MGPLWILPLAFAVLTGTFLTVYRVAGDRARERLLPAVCQALILATALDATGYARQGYADLGLDDGWARALALLHQAIVLLVAVRGTYVARRAALNPPPRFLSEDDLRYLARRPRAWRRARLLTLASLLLIIAIGTAA